MEDTLSSSELNGTSENGGKGKERGPAKDRSSDPERNLKRDWRIVSQKKGQRLKASWAHHAVSLKRGTWGEGKRNC